MGSYRVFPIPNVYPNYLRLYDVTRLEEPRANLAKVFCITHVLRVERWLIYSDV